MLRVERHLLLADGGRLLLLQKHLHVQLRCVHHHVVAGASVVHRVRLHHHLASHLLEELLLAAQINLIHRRSIVWLSLLCGLGLRSWFSGLSQVSITVRVAAFVAIAAVAQLLEMSALDGLIV